MSARVTFWSSFCKLNCAGLSVCQPFSNSRNATNQLLLTLDEREDLIEKGKLPVDKAPRLWISKALRLLPLHSTLSRVPGPSIKLIRVRQTASLQLTLRREIPNLARWSALQCWPIKYPDKMTPLPTSRFLKLASVLILCASLSNGQLSIRPAIKGPLRVQGNLLQDSNGLFVTLQGTQAPADLGLKYAGTMFSTIRQRWNMNAVSLPLSVEESETAGYFDRIEEIVRRANQSELLVILAAHEDGAALPSDRTAAFWKQCAAHFKNNSRIIFDLFSEPSAEDIPGHKPGVRTDAEWLFWLRGGTDLNGRKSVGMQALVDAVRSTGAKQIVTVMAFEDEMLLRGFPERYLVSDPNVIYEVCPLNHVHNTDAARDRDFGYLAARVPVLAMDWDFQLDQNDSECLSVPRDPKAAKALVRSHMNYFDTKSISWMASSFTPGKLIFSLDAMEPTELWKELRCGVAESPAVGMGLEVQMHQWSMTQENLITVSAGAGGVLLPLSGLAIGYGVVTKIPELAAGWPLPTSVGGVSIRVTDSNGTARLSPILYAGIGQVNYWIEPQTALGLATVELLRADGSPGLTGSIIIEAISPGLFTATGNARGPVSGVAHYSRNGQPITSVVYECDAAKCSTVPIPVSGETATLIELYGTGFRDAKGPFRVTLGNLPVRIVSVGTQPGVAVNDRIVIELEQQLKGLGEEDLVFFVGEKISNVVRLQVE